MRALVLVIVLVSTAAGAASGEQVVAAPEAQTLTSEVPSARYVRPRLGLSIAVPAGWTIVRRSLTNCTDPVQRIALRRGSATIQIVESVYWGAKGIPPRPRWFALRGEPEFLGCCPPADGKGWFLRFKDSGRGFYAYVYLGRTATRSEALRILDSFQIRTRL